MTKPSLRTIPVPGPGAEDVVVDGSGLVWTGTADGRIWRVRPDGRQVDQVGDTGGRPLGLELLPDDRLLVADAKQGLLAMDKTTGAIERLVDAVDGRRMLFCNNAAVARNGDIWFSDTSTQYGIDEWKADFVQNTQTGRLFVRRANGRVERHLDGLAFANGVALAADESFVLVAETGRRTVVRLWLSGDRAGTHELFCEDLPGYPDNIARGSDDLVWVTIASPKDPVVELLQHRASLGVRKLVTRIPVGLQPKPKRTARVQAYDDTGRLVHDLDADSSTWHMATGVREHDGQVWLGSLEEPAVAVLASTAD
ncbi:MAG: SMP-30/gluconolactonase/LRE family protein [Actinomycetota bacterium]|nr:SMP-30/gluconolactonase/LRE family protein [Actinomycetota bacterium]